MAKTKSVFGIYSKKSEAESAVNALRDAGFLGSDISVLSPENREAVEERQIVADHTTKAPQGAAVGIGSGAAIGGALGWIVGVGALAIPGIGPVIAAGPIVTTLVGIGIGGAFGGFAGALVGVGISADEVEKYDGRIGKGEMLLAVHCETQEEMQGAREIMEMTNAANVDSSGFTVAGGRNAA